MDKEIAKEFLFLDKDSRKIYLSKDLQKLMDMNDGELFWIYAIIETKSGDTLMNMDFAYSGEPIIMNRFIHKDYFMRHYHFYEVVNI